MAMNATQAETNSGGKKLNLSIGTNYLFSAETLKGTRLAVDWAFPVYQDVTGYQMNNNSTLTFGIQKAY